VTGALSSGGRVAVTAVLERTRKAAHELFAHSGLEGRAATRVVIARGSKTEWDEQNPVIIFTGDRPDKSKPHAN
jgi:precorrin-6B methylase 2